MLMVVDTIVFIVLFTIDAIEGLLNMESSEKGGGKGRDASRWR